MHVVYAPEFESIEDLREKLDERRFIVELKCKKYDEMNFGTLKYDLMMKNFATKLRPRRKKKVIDKKKVVKSISQIQQT